MAKTCLSHRSARLPLLLCQANTLMLEVPSKTRCTVRTTQVSKIRQCKLWTGQHCQKWSVSGCAQKQKWPPGEWNGWRDVLYRYCYLGETSLLRSYSNATGCNVFALVQHWAWASELLLKPGSFRWCCASRIYTGCSEWRHISLNLRAEDRIQTFQKFKCLQS